MDNAESIARTLGTIDAKLDTMVSMVQQHHKELYGNGREGLVLSVDRIKTKVGTIVWLTTALVSALVYAGGEQLWRLLIH